MSTIVVVSKNGTAAIAADTMTKYGSGKETATYVKNNEKIVPVGESYIALAGPTVAKFAVADYFSSQKDVRLDTPMGIFKAWVGLHGALKEKYFLQAEDEDAAFETMHFESLIANASGIFAVAAHRTIQEMTRFYALGSGADFALGAMFVAYENPELSAEQIARIGVEAAAEFDDSTGLPLTCYTIPLREGEAPSAPISRKRKVSKEAK